MEWYNAASDLIDRHLPARAKRAAFIDERCLPAGVTGPVDLAEFMVLMSLRMADFIGCSLVCL